MQYRCIVLSENGTETEQIINAENEKALNLSFQGSASVLLRYSEIRRQKRKTGNHITGETVLQFTESLSALLSAGLSIQDSLSICAETSEKKQLTKLCEEIKRIILEGGLFYTSLSLFAPSFSPLYIALVKIGETTGSVEKVFNKLTLYLKRKRETKQKILQALAYPITVCATAIGIGFFIIIYVLPRIQTIFEIFNAEAGTAEAVHNFNTLTDSIWYISGGIAVLLLIILFLLYFRSYSRLFTLVTDNFILRLPLIGTAVKTFCTSDFAFSMEILCSAGIPFMQAMEQSKEVVSNTAFKKALENSMTHIAEGMPITGAFKAQKIFPGYVTSWIGIGERTGSVEKIFSQIHSYFEHESSRLVSNIADIAQPAFILLAGAIVIYLVWRFILPIFSLIGGL